MKGSRVAAVVGALALLGVAGGAQAHHSAAMFDRDKNMTLEGTVKEFKFTNPHVWVYLVVGSGSAAQQWALEGGSVSALARSGWKKSTVKVGDKIKVVIHPRRDGSNGGEFNLVTLANGTSIRSSPQY